MQGTSRTFGLAKKAVMYIGILALALVLLLLLGAGQAGAEEVTGDITTDTTWVSGDVYNISSSVTVVDGATLEIQAGATVIFNGTNYLNVEGAMFVNGTAGQPVIFTNNASKGMGGGIVFLGGSDGSVSFAHMSNCTMAIYFDNVTIPCSDIVIDSSNCGLYYSFYGMEQNITLALSDITMTDTDYAIIILQYNGTVDLAVTDSMLKGGMYGLYVETWNGGSAVITNTQFLGQEYLAYHFYSLYGEMDVNIADSVFDGSEAADMTVYTVEEVENTFEVIGWNNWNWGVDAWSPSTTWVDEALIDLPFAFAYNGFKYSSVTISSDGYLNFGSDNCIEPVGNTDLIYSGYSYARQCYGYKVAEDNRSVMFHWYASDWYSGPYLSIAFQVVLFADGTIQFNYGDMEAYEYYYADHSYGLRTDGSTIYDLRSLYGMPKYEADGMAFLFTPLPLSNGVAAQLWAEEGAINVEITDSTFTSYYGGGISVRANNGGLALTVTGSEFSKIYNNEFNALDLYNFNGAAELTMTDNTFRLIWGLAISLDLTSTEGWEGTIDVSDSVFDKVAYVLYAEINVNDNSGRTGDDSLNATVIFRNNMLTDSFGMFCEIGLELDDPVNWTVTVAQTMTGNTMVQENYMGSWSFPDNYPEAPGLGVFVWIEQEGEDENSVTLEQTATVTGNHIECPWSMGIVGIAVGNEIVNLYGDTTRTFAVDISRNFVNCTDLAGIAAVSMMTAGTGFVVDDAIVTMND
ncbi:MAG TPA: hypothetical protein PLJ11_06875, partial [Methanomassiliicoccales archaeon]|nr:hypothetical protein [Methanomassiliicoccales archaeon]